jgi:arylsulfatase A
MSRREFLEALGGGAAALAVPGLVGCTDCGRGPLPRTPRPNVLIALCDDLGYGDLACYGHPEIRTPRLDELAAQGVRFTDCYAAAPVSSPARAGMLTGRTPNRVGVYDWIPGGSPVHLRREEVSVATLLRDAGYDTCHVGKWHLNGMFNSSEQPQPSDHGFEYWFSTQNNAYPSHSDPENFVRNGTPVGALSGYSSALIVQEAIDWLAGVWDRRRPFCLFVWFHSPHEPVATGAEFTSMYPAAEPDRAIYYGNVTQVDHEFGRLTDALDGMGLAEETFVMFTSDNGPETLNRYVGAERSYGSPGGLRGMKLWLYEGGIRVPGIVRWPGRAAAGAECSEPVSGTDVLPTLCEIARVPAPADRAMDGASFVPVFGGAPLARSVPLYWQYDSALGTPKIAVREGDWKILATGDLGAFELYDLGADPGETTDLALSEPDRVADLSARLIRLHDEIAAEGPVW